MKVSVSKIVSRVNNSAALSRAALTAGPAMLNGVGRVPYHTFAGNSRVIPKSVLSSSSNVTFPYKTFAQHTALPAVSKLPREIVWLLGAPGAGKGTNSSFVASSRGIQAPTIVMSSLLENPECKRIKEAGGMVDDAVVCRALLEELSKPIYRNGVVVDGFPRTKEQAEWICKLHESVSEAAGGIVAPPRFSFVMLSLSEEVSISRQISRGNAIRELNNVRRVSGLEEIEERATDTNEGAARNRYRVFAEQYEAVTRLSSRFSLVAVDADASIETVRMRLSSALRKPTTTSTTTSSRIQFSFPSSVSRESKLVFA